MSVQCKYKNVLNEEPTCDIIGASRTANGARIFLLNDSKADPSPSLCRENYDYCKDISYKENIVGDLVGKIYSNE